MIRVNTMEEAWDLVGEMRGDGWKRDEEKSKRAGHGIYENGTNDGVWVSDLGCRLEVNTQFGSTNIWIKDENEDMWNSLKKKCNENKDLIDAIKKIKGENDYTKELEIEIRVYRDLMKEIMK